MVEISQNLAPTHALTDKQLKWSYWYVTHKKLLRQVLAGFLITLSVVFWVYVLWQMTFYALTYKQEAKSIRGLVAKNNYGLAVEGQKPNQLQLSGLNALSASDGRYDVYVQVANANNNWAATFNYQFVADGVDTVTRQGFVLPGERKYLMELGLKSANVKLEITNQKWEKVGNYSFVKNERLQFEITDSKYIAGSGGSDPSRLIFTIKNNSAYSYWEVGVQALLMSGGNLASANYIVLDQLKSGESRKVEVYWNTDLPKINNFQVIPDVNILDEDNIMPPE